MLHGITWPGRAAARATGAPCAQEASPVAVPVVLPETLRAVTADQVRTVTGVQRVTGRLSSFQDHRLSRDVALLIDPEPPGVFGTGAGRLSTAEMSTYRQVAELTWHTAGQPGPGGDDISTRSTRSAAAGPRRSRGRDVSAVTVSPGTADFPEAQPKAPPLFTRWNEAAKAMAARMSGRRRPARPHAPSGGGVAVAEQGVDVRREAHEETEE